VAPPKERERSVPFGVHQAIEYLLGAFAFTSLARVEPASAALCAGAGVALVLLAGLSGGRLGFSHVLGLRLHRALDYVAVPVLATSPWWSGVGWRGGSVWVVESLAVALLWLARATSYRRAPVPEAPAAAAPGPTPASDALAGTARAAGRLAGTVGRKGPRAAGLAVGRIKKRRSDR
jgi:hypothetical protein